MDGTPIIRIPNVILVLTYMNSFSTQQIISEISTEPFLPNHYQGRNPVFPGSFLRYQKKMMELMRQGYTREQAEKMCQPKEIDMEKVEQEVMEWQVKELRRLAKLSPKGKKTPKVSKTKSEEKEEIEIAWVDIKCPDQFKIKDN